LVAVGSAIFVCFLEFDNDADGLLSALRLLLSLGLGMILSMSVCSTGGSPPDVGIWVLLSLLPVLVLLVVEGGVRGAGAAAGGAGVSWRAAMPMDYGCSHVTRVSQSSRVK
jgi:hypothetical protein